MLLRPFVRSALLFLALTVAAAGGFTLGRSLGETPFEAYRDVRARVLAHQRTQPADGALVLLGSSTLERLNPARLGVATSNLALGGDTIADVLDRLPPEPLLTRSAGAVVLVGFNDLRQGAGAEEALRDYDRLLVALDRAPLTFCLTLQSLAPDAARDDPSLAARIDEFNEGVRQRCTEGERRKLVDLQRALRTIPNDSRDSLYVDEIHLSPKGYEVLTTTLAEVIDRVPGRGA